MPAIVSVEESSFASNRSQQGGALLEPDCFQMVLSEEHVQFALRENPQGEHRSRQLTTQPLVGAVIGHHDDRLQLFRPGFEAQLPGYQSARFERSIGHLLEKILDAVPDSTERLLKGDARNFLFQRSSSNRHLSSTSPPHNNQI